MKSNNTRNSLWRKNTPIYGSGGIFVVAALAVCAAFRAEAESPIEKGKALFFKCVSEEVDIRKDAAALDAAKAQFAQALNDPATAEEAAVMLLRVAYIKGTYAPLTNDQRKQVFDESTRLGEKMVAKYRDSGPIRLRLAICWGRWAETFGMFAAARKGVADKVKQLCEQAVALGPEDTTADAYRVLGRLHAAAPRIPAILPWPSKEKAVSALEQCNRMEPNIPATLFFLGEVYSAQKRKDDAVRVLEAGARLRPRPEEHIDDSYYIGQCAELLKKLRG